MYADACIVLGFGKSAWGITLRMLSFGPVSPLLTALVHHLPTLPIRSPKAGRAGQIAPRSRKRDSEASLLSQTNVCMPEARSGEANACMHTQRERHAVTRRAVRNRRLRGLPPGKSDDSPGSGDACMEGAAVASSKAAGRTGPPGQSRAFWQWHATREELIIYRLKTWQPARPTKRKKKRQL